MSVTEKNQYVSPVFGAVSGEFKDPAEEEKSNIIKNFEELNSYRVGFEKCAYEFERMGFEEQASMCKKLAHWCMSSRWLIISQFDKRDEK